jgi:phospholipase/carboxylesterase
LAEVVVEEMAGFGFVRVAGDGSPVAPLVLLHGSGGDETSLLAFARAVAPGRVAFGVRGPVAWEGGFAFFRRNADRSLDLADLAARCEGFCGFLREVAAAGGRKPVLVGYSNGAIMAAAAVLRAPASSSGAVLLRGLSPLAGAGFPALGGYPVLLVGGDRDARRGALDTPVLAGQFRAAGAVVAEFVEAVGHGLEDWVDGRLVREWLVGLSLN